MRRCASIFILFSSLTFIGGPDVYAAQICRTAFSRVLELLQVPVSVSPIESPDRSEVVSASPETTRPSPVQSFDEQKKNLLERIQYLTTKYESKLTEEEPNDISLLAPRLTTRAWINRTLLKASQAPYNWTLYYEMHQRYQTLVNENGNRPGAEILFGLKYVLRVEEQAASRNLESPTRAELRMRYHWMREGRLDWPQDPLVRQILGLGAPFEAAPEHAPEVVEEYLDYQELSHLQTAIDYLEIRLRLQGVRI